MSPPSPCWTESAAGTRRNRRRGVTSFLEAALFAFFLMAVVGMGAAQWVDIVGDGQNPIPGIGLALTCGCVVLGTMGVVGRWRRDQPARSPASWR